MTIIATVVRGSEEKDIKELLSSSKMTHVECGGNIVPIWVKNAWLRELLVLHCSKCKQKNELMVNLEGENWHEENIAMVNLLSGKINFYNFRERESFCLIWKEGGKEEEAKKKGKEKTKKNEENSDPKTKNLIIALFAFIIIISVLLWITLG